jgi:hypothetical protein
MGEWKRPLYGPTFGTHDRPFVKRPRMVWQLPFEGSHLAGNCAALVATHSVKEHVNQSLLHLKLTYGIPAGRRSRFASRLIPKSSPDDKYVETRGGRSAIQKLLNGGKLSARHRASMGEIRGTLRISRRIDFRK